MKTLGVRILLAAVIAAAAILASCSPEVYKLGDLLPPRVDPMTGVAAVSSVMVTDDCGEKRTIPADGVDSFYLNLESLECTDGSRNDGKAVYTAELMSDGAKVLCTVEILSEYALKIGSRNYILIGGKIDLGYFERIFGA